MVFTKFDLLGGGDFFVALDLGCGPGENIGSLLDRAGRVVGIDIEAEAIGQARRLRNNGRVTFLRADIGKLPLADECADLAVLSEVLEHCVEDQRVITEIRRVLRSGGTLLLTSPHRGLFRFLDPLNFGYYFPRLYRWLGLAAKRRRKGESAFHRHYQLPELAALLDGFEIQRVHRGGLVIHPVISSIDAAALKFLPSRLPESWRRYLYKIAAWEVSLPFGMFAYDVWILARRR